MEKLSINNISKNFFKPAQSTHQKVESNQTNPFGVSFKGNVLTADVFETKKNSKISFTGASANLISKAANKSRMLSSAVVGSINNFGSAIGTRLNTIVNHGRRMGEKVSNLWKQAQSIEININPKAIIEGTEELIASAKNSIKSKLQLLNDNNPMRGLPVEDLSARLEAKLATIKEV